MTAGAIMIQEKSRFGLGSYEEALEQMGEYNKPRFGFISIEDYVEDFLVSQGGAKLLTIEETEEKLEESNYMWEHDGGDNSYNYSGYLARDINVNKYFNPETEETIVFISVHIGSDARFGYTDAFAVYFDGDEDSWLETMLNSYPIAYAEINIEGVPYFYSVDGQAFSEEARMYLATDNNDQVDFDYPEYGYVDTYDQDDFKDWIVEAFEEFDIAVTKEDIKVIE